MSLHLGAEMALSCRECQWHELTSLHVGLGKVRLWTLETEEDLRELPSAPSFLPLGAGTNLLGSDQDGANLLRLAPPPAPLPLPEKNGLLTVPASLPLPLLASLCARQGWIGLAPLSGIPGTLGGAIRMNAGARGTAIADFLEEWSGIHLPTGTPLRWTRDDGPGGFAYRQSPVPPDGIVLHATLRLAPGDPRREMEAIRQEHLRRQTANPQGPSAGSIFRNPPGEFAGRLLEEAGCKGLRRGPLVVSEKHANWILNPDAQPASTEDALWLIREMQRRVPGLLPEVQLPRF
ncbi:MAG: UDP-N-acetylmuramate dehydrogenase [Oligosphaeraceae bacterium]